MDKKTEVLITAESAADIPVRLKEYYGIETIPFYIKTDKGIFTDFEEIRGGNLIEYIELNGSYPEIIPPTADEFSAFFSARLSRAESIVHISSGGEWSAAYRNAVEAAINMDKVYIVDSGQLSSGIALGAINAAKMAQSGFSARVIKTESEAYFSGVENTVMAGNEKYVRHSGIMPGFLCSLCDTFHLKSAFKVSKGAFTGNRNYLEGVESCMEQYVRHTLKNSREIDAGTLIITSSGCTYGEIQRLKELVEKRIHFENIYTVDYSCTLGWIFGRGSYGLVFGSK